MAEESDNKFDEFFNLLWETYPADLAHRKKGSKPRALAAIVKLNPDKDLQGKIITNLRELIRYGRLEIKANGKTDRWPLVSSWINGEYWNMLEDIEMPSTLYSKIAAKKCKCGQPIDIVDKCWKCHDEANPIHRAWRRDSYNHLVSLGLGKRVDEDARSWGLRCRDWGRQNTSMGKSKHY